MRATTVAAASSFAVNVHHLLQSLECRPIESSEDLERVMRLRYAAYLKEGAIGPNETGLLEDRFDALENAVNVGVFRDEKLVAAKRFHFLSKPDDVSPTYFAFHDVLLPHLEAGKRIIDPNRFIVDYDTAREFPHLAYATVRLSVMASAYYDAHLTTVSVRPEHQAFYKRAFFAAQAATPRQYPGLTKQLCLMLVDYEKDRHRIYERGSYYASTAEEQALLFGKIKAAPGSHAAAA
jgi:Autoinducer synthase